MSMCSKIQGCQGNLSLSKEFVCEGCESKSSGLTSLFNLWGNRQTVEQAFASRPKWSLMRFTIEYRSAQALEITNCACAVLGFGVAAILRPIPTCFGIVIAALHMNHYGLKVRSSVPKIAFCKRHVLRDQVDIQEEFKRFKSWKIRAIALKTIAAGGLITRYYHMKYHGLIVPWIAANVACFGLGAHGFFAMYRLYNRLF